MWSLEWEWVSFEHTVVSGDAVFKSGGYKGKDKCLSGRRGKARMKRCDVEGRG